MVRYILMDQIKFAETPPDPLAPIRVIEIDSAHPDQNYTFEQKYGSSHKVIYLLHFLQEFWKKQGPELYATARTFDYGYLPVLCFLERPQPPHHPGESSWDWLMEELAIIFSPEEYRLGLMEECFKMDNLMQMELRSGLRKLMKREPWKSI